MAKVAESIIYWFTLENHWKMAFTRTAARFRNSLFSQATSIPGVRSFFEEGYSGNSLIGAY